MSSRRHFIRNAGLAIASPALLSAQTRSTPSERVTMGFIGIGGRGIGVMEAFLNHADVQGVAVCDVHDLHHRDLEWGKGRKMGREPGKAIIEAKYAEQTRSGTYQGCSAYSDYRELLARDDIDAVLIATPDHWHAQQTLEALASGKDVYCEKPITHTFAEGRAVCDAVQKYGRIFQVGSQQRSEANFRQAVELVRNGHIGKITQVEVGLPTGYAKPKGDATIADPPAGLDFDRWSGSAPKLPYMRARHHRWWRGNSAYGGGNLMDFIGHHNDIAHWGLGQENGGPIRVEAMGWTFPETEIYDQPIDFEVHCDYANGASLNISTQVTSGTKWIGDNGWVWVNRGKLEASNPEWLSEDFDRGSWKAYQSPGHQRNFTDSVKSRRETVAPAENAHRSISPGHLAFVSQKLGRALTWDPAKETIAGDESAQSLLSKV